MGHMGVLWHLHGGGFKCPLVQILEEAAKPQGERVDFDSTREEMAELIFVTAQNWEQAAAELMQGREKFRKRALAQFAGLTPEALEGLFKASLEQVLIAIAHFTDLT